MLRPITASIRTLTALICVLATFACGVGAAAALSVSAGESYWLASSRGQVFAYGKAHAYGSEAGKGLRGSIIGIVSTPDGKGYWLISSIGRRFSFGDAHLYRYHSTKLQKPTGAVSVKGLRGRLVGIAIARLPVTVKTTTGTQTAIPPVKTITSAAPAAGLLSPSIITTSVPYPVEDLPYSATLSATGGDAPFTWALATGSSLPIGLSLSSGGTLSGTATTPGTYEFTVTATGTDGATARSTYMLMVADSTNSFNWSGYVETTTAAYTSAGGTFTVPALDSSDANDTAMAEWVGIDGATDSDLIQAGVENDPTDGTYAWWEVLPASETPILEPVQPGDHVSVNISEDLPAVPCDSSASDDPVSDGFDWQLTITDATEGWNYPVTLCYAGPGASAEWILEAPEEQVTQHHQTVDEIVPLADFSPDVTFSNLTSSTAASGLTYMTMVQQPGTPTVCNPTCQAPVDSTQTATPSPLDSSGFNVAYGATAPASP